MKADKTKHGTGAAGTEGEVSDRVLVGKILGGNRGAFGTLYSRYGDAVYRFVLSFSFERNADDAMDITAQAFTECLRSLVTFAGRSSFKTWLFGIARHCVLRFYGHRDRVHQTVRLDAKNPEADEGKALRMTDSDPTPDSAYSADSEKRLLWDLIGSLRGDRREVVLCRYINGFSTEETAQILGRSPEAVKVLLSRALKDLRKKMEARLKP